MDRLGKTFLSHLWQGRKDRLAIGDRSCRNRAPSSRGRVANDLTAKARNQLEYDPPPDRQHAIRATAFPDGARKRMSSCYNLSAYNSLCHVGIHRTSVGIHCISRQSGVVRH
ncbi:unnamed protein product, partial [Ectocarpus sp. 13 AM-2016]